MSRIAIFFVFLVFIAPTALYAGVERAGLEKGIAELKKGDYSNCIPSFTSYLQSARDSHDGKGQADAQYWLSRCYFELRRIDDSLKYAKGARDLYESKGDKGGLLSADAILIELLVEKKSFREAHRLINLAQKLLAGNCPQEAKIDFLIARGRFLIEKGEPELSGKSYQAALEEARTAGEPSREVRALIGLTLVNLFVRPFVPRKDFIEARETAYAAQRIALERNVGPFLQAQSHQICMRMELNDNKNDKALMNALSARAIYELTGNRRREADVLSTMSYIYNVLKEPEKVIACIDEAIKLFKAEGDTLSLIPEYRFKAARLDKTDPLNVSERNGIMASLGEIAEKDGDYLCRIEALRGIISLLNREKENETQKSQIAADYERIIKIAHDADDTGEEMRALIEKADTLSSNPREALELYEQALSLHKSMGNPDRIDAPLYYGRYSEGTIFAKMAMALSAMKDTQEAMGYYGKAAECNLADGIMVDAAQNYIALLSCALSIYDIDTSLEAFDKAVSAINRHKDETWKSRCFGELMRPFRVLELWQKSVAGERLSLRESLSMLLIEKILNDKELLSRMDRAYDEMLERCSNYGGLTEITARGEYAKWALLKKDYGRARDEYEMAISLLRKEVNDEHEWDYESYYESILADIYLLSGKSDKAIECQKNAVELSKRDGRRYCSELEHLARIMKKAGRDKEAEECSELARMKRKEVDKPTSDFWIARELWEDEHNAQGALEHYQKALVDFQKRGLKGNEAWTLDSMGQVYDRAGNLTKAVEHYGGAIGFYREQGDLYNLCEVSLRCGMALEKQSLESEALKVYLEALDRIVSQWTRNDSVVSQLRLSADSSVLSLFERAIRLLMKSGKSDEALKYLELSHSLELIDGIRLEDLKLTDRELQSLLARLTTLRQRMSLVEGELSQTSEENRKRTLKEILSTTRQELFTTVNSIKGKNPDMEQFLSVRITDLAALQRMLPKDTLLVEYFPSEDMLYIFGITSDSFITKKVSVPRQRLYDAVKEFRSHISSPDAGAPGTEKSFLYSKLLEPLEDEMSKRARLVIVPGGMLWYLPFEALGPSADSYVLTSRTLSYLSSAHVLTMISNNVVNNNEKERMLAFGAPPGADLPGAEAELKSIAYLYPGSVLCAGSAATKENLFRNAGDKSIIHIASHSSLDAVDINKSFIELAGHDGKLYLGEVYGLLLDPSSLVTLSSCRSAIGEENPGREFASLASAFTTAGSSTVIASQWRVDDEATAKLFIEFYGNLKKKRTRSEALREAKLSLLKSPGTSHPYYWASFVLLGDWR